MATICDTHHVLPECWLRAGREAALVRAELKETGEGSCFLTSQNRDLHPTDVDLTPPQRAKIARPPLRDPGVGGGLVVGHPLSWWVCSPEARAARSDYLMAFPCDGAMRVSSPTEAPYSTYRLGQMPTAYFRFNSACAELL